MGSWNEGDVITAAALNAMPTENLAQEVALIAIPLTSFRYADGSIPNTTGAAGNPKLVMGGWGNGSGIFQGQDAHGATKTETLVVEFAVPHEYVKGEDIMIFAAGRVYDTGAGVMSTKTIDVEAHRINTYGGSYGDICVTPAQTLATYNLAYSFGLDGTDLEPGELIRALIRIVITESGGTGAQYAQFLGAGVFLYRKG